MFWARFGIFQSQITLSHKPQYYLKKHSTICVDISTRQTDLFGVCIIYREIRQLCVIRSFADFKDKVQKASRKYRMACEILIQGYMRKLEFYQTWM